MHSPIDWGESKARFIWTMCTTLHYSVRPPLNNSRANQSIIILIIIILIIIEVGRSLFQLFTSIRKGPFLYNNAP